MEVINHKIFIYPTDTVWGIGSSIYSKEGHERIQKVKGSSFGKPLSILFSSIEMLDEFVDFPLPWGRDLKRKFFSMETTLLVEKKHLLKEIPQWNLGNSELVGIRVLENELIKRITTTANGPITTTSLNLNGENPICRENEAKVFFENHLKANEAIFFTSGQVELSGQSSTIFSSQNNRLDVLREGRNWKRIKDEFGL